MHAVQRDGVLEAGVVVHLGQRVGAVFPGDAVDPLENVVDVRFDQDAAGADFLERSSAGSASVSRVDLPPATSSAKLGPPIEPVNRVLPSSSSSTCVINAPLPCSMPLLAVNATVPGFNSGAT